MVSVPAKPFSRPLRLRRTAEGQIDTRRWVAPSIRFRKRLRDLGEPPGGKTGQKVRFYRNAGGPETDEAKRRLDGFLEAGVTAVSTRRVDVSSTEIRDRLRAGKSIKGFVPESVERFIDARGLYR